MKGLRGLSMALCAGALCGCVPETVMTAGVETITNVCGFSDDLVAVYSVGEEQHALLKDEFETWQRAGVGGFDESFVRCTPQLLVQGTTTNGVSYKIDFREDRVLVFEEKGEMVDGTRYARDATDADKRFRQYLLTCIASGALPRLAKGKLPVSE